MADIFISYARSTAQQAQRIAEALRVLGYGVWRDDELPAHRAYAEVIEERLKAAKAVVVIWSAEAVRSEWVRAEADRARNDRKLVQLTIDGTSLPLPFDQVQCADLSGWSGDLNAPGWRKVIASIGDLMGVAVAVPVPSIQNQRQGVSICVLPFANMSNDADQEYFSDGISEDIITDLSKVSALGVIARNSAFAFKGRSVDIKQVARQLEVSHVLEGSVRKSGNRVRITAQLINGATNEHVWAERYDRDLADIFALQDEISEAIVAALKVKLLPEEKQAIEDRGTKNLEAYDLALRGNAASAEMGYENTARGTALLRKALALDPAFSLARRGLVEALRSLAFLTTADRASVQQEIVDLIEGGILQAKDLAQAHYWRGLQKLQAQDLFGAEQAFERSVALRPALEAELMQQRFQLLADVGCVSEAAPLASEMARNDPLSLLRSVTLQGCLVLLGRLAEAEAEYRRAQALLGDHGPTEFVALLRMWPDLSPAERKERYRSLRASSDLFAASYHARLEQVLDQPEAARRVLRHAYTEIRDREALGVARLSLWASLFDDQELALDCLRRAYVDLGLTAGLLKWQPNFAATRQDARFKQLMRDLGIYEYWRKSGKWGDFARAKGDDDFEIIR